MPPSPTFAPRKVNLRELMSRTIRIKKGADIRLKGRPSSKVEAAPTTATYAVLPPNYQGIVPKLEVKEGAAVDAGSVLFHSKEHPEVKFLSPVSGTVKEIRRGEKRKILAVVVEADGKGASRSFEKVAPGSLNAEAALQAIQERGFFGFIDQRPFATVANPNVAPRSIFVSGFDSAPLAADMEVVLAGRKEAFQAGIEALQAVINGKPVNLGIKRGQTCYEGLKGLEVSEFEGPHPAGNVGVQIHHTAPLNKGETIWTMHPEDVANLGATLTTGQYHASRTIAVGGSECADPKHLTTTLGCEIQSVTGKVGEDVRIVSGNPLTGDRTATEGWQASPS
jgi:Na+-transporting NADH:ubiquinone oxidoreductase subunit A